MGTPFISELRLMSFNFPPRGWALCNGQQLPINQNQALFSLLGTTYGGNGQTTFALPNLQGRVPIHTGNGHTLGEAAGASTVTLTQQQMPQHTHTLSAQTEVMLPTTVTQNPTGKVFAAPRVGLQGGGNGPVQLYAPANNLTALNAQSSGNAGGSLPHYNMMPYLTLNWCIALQGIFPSQN